MQPNPKREYKINYKLCTQNQQHEGEKLNFVCLNQTCSHKSLICSICREEQHKGHSTKPLKFYIQDLKKRYESQKKDFNQEFQSLEESRLSFLVMLRQSVEKVAEEFKKLEEQIIQKFDLLHEQILQEQSRQNKFTQFYESLSLLNEDNPEFLIQNYLPKQKIGAMTNTEPIQSLGKKLASVVCEAKVTIFSSNQKPEELKNLDNLVFKLPMSITKVDNVFTQTNIYSQETLCVIPLDFVKNFQNLKFKIKVIKMKAKKGATIHIGALNKKLFETEKHMNFTTKMGNKNGKIFYYANNGTTYGQTISSAKPFHEQSNIQVNLDKDLMRITFGKGSAEFKLPQNQEHYFFFNLLGEVSVEFNHFVK